MKIIGYGICGPGEANRYMRETLDCFARLCDTVIILCNNTTRAENDLIDSYGFERVSDRREWGLHQWKIKQDFIERDIKQIADAGDMLVCLDMDEVLDKHLDREWILAAPLDAYHVFVVDLWEDGYKPESCFWNVRLWRWNGETKFKAKPVHCGLAPEWAYHYHRHAPFILKHYGLKDKENRLRKIERYKKYDPHGEHLDKKYYDMLSSDSCKPFDEDLLHEKIAAEVATYKQTKPQTDMTTKKKERFAYVKNPHGSVIDIPERHFKETMKRSGFEFIGWADEQAKEMDELFEDVVVEGDETNAEPVILDGTKGSYQRGAADEKTQIDELNAADDATLSEEEVALLSKKEPDLEAFSTEEIAEAMPPKEPEKPKVDKSKPLSYASRGKGKKK